ncbi:dimethylsulfonioproprionate lyase family protein [Loktanella sp. Alg231-35]|uniref:dimethylsulfonioproprionate lyase family protein n=1 Tax=Loktanella sp. Alg231-35 TaxID=1922220 RepID=UPI00131F15D6|nr:dimethylsulfonioproprionate lyase family protein [Loktanella sp. Alg231-35]
MYQPTSDQDVLLKFARMAYDDHPDTRAFAAFPHDVIPQPVDPHSIPAAALLASETALATTQYPDLRDAIIAVGATAQWRETYKGTHIGQDFLDRFGCYSIIGNGGPFTSESLWMWAVYMPPHLHYPWHHHPGEEIYLVLAGQASFAKDGEAPQILHPGMTSFHASNQPHAMTTFDHPVLCLVIWRNGFQTAPVLTEDQ